MPKSKSPKSMELRACTQCQKRKTKCSGSLPCLYCSRNNKSCIFAGPPSRTPLTRKNLDKAEKRNEKLLSLIHQLSPDLNIEEALIKGPNVGMRVKASPETAPEVDIEIVTPGSDQTCSSDRFEWTEVSCSSRRKEPPDGMASLPRGEEAGYLGNSSGSSLLKTISDMLPENPDDSSQPIQENQDETSTNTETLLLSANLTEGIVIDRLIDAYFVSYNPSFPILHERTFRERHQNRHTIPAQSSWHPIFYLVLAIGDWILSGGEAEKSRYYAAARSRMSMRMLESGTLLTVQAFLLMGNYLQKRDRPNTGYNCIGIAYRMALGLGLHRELPSNKNNDTLLNERRRVVWWIVYCFDSGFSLTTGRPVTASDSFIETRLPRNIDDQECTLSSILPPPTPHPTTYSAIIAQARLATLANRVYSDLISAPRKEEPTPTPFDLKTSRSLEHQLKAWKLSLPIYFVSLDIPSWFRGPRAIIGWKEQNLRMMLWWGSQRLCTSPLDHDEARNMCHYAAVETIQDISNFCRCYADALHCGLSWYATYFLFQATLVLSIHHLRPSVLAMDSGLEAVNQELWFLSIESARECLAGLSGRDKAASRCLAVLDRIRDSSRKREELNMNNSVGDIVSGETGVQQDVQHISADPALQIFFEDTAWNDDIFEGVQGFPSTDELDFFDYVSANSFVNSS